MRMKMDSSALVPPGPDGGVVLPGFLPDTRKNPRDVTVRRGDYSGEEVLRLGRWQPTWGNGSIARAPNFNDDGGGYDTWIGAKDAAVEIAKHRAGMCQTCGYAPPDCACRSNPPGRRVVVKKEDGQWAAIVYDGNNRRNEALTYYASDEEDALDTAAAMRSDFIKYGKINPPRERLHSLGDGWDRVARSAFTDAAIKFNAHKHKTSEPIRMANGLMREHWIGDGGIEIGFLVYDPNEKRTGRAVRGYYLRESLLSDRKTRDNPTLMLVTGMANPQTIKASVAKAWARFHQKREFTGEVLSFPNIKIPGRTTMFVVGEIHAIDLGAGEQKWSRGAKPILACDPEDQSLWVVSEEPINAGKLSGAEVVSVTYDPPPESGKERAHFLHHFDVPLPQLAPVGDAKKAHALKLDGGVYGVTDWLRH